MSVKHFSAQQLFNALGKLVFSYNELDWFLAYVSMNYLDKSLSASRFVVSNMRFDDRINNLLTMYEERELNVECRKKLFELLKKVQEIHTKRGRYIHSKMGFASQPDHVELRRLARKGKVDAKEISIKEIEDFADNIFAVLSELSLFFSTQINPPFKLPLDLE